MSDYYEMAERIRTGPAAVQRCARCGVVHLRPPKAAHYSAGSRGSDGLDIPPALSWLCACGSSIIALLPATQNGERKGL